MTKIGVWDSKVVYNNICKSLKLVLLRVRCRLFLREFIIAFLLIGTIKASGKMPPSKSEQEATIKIDSLEVVLKTTQDATSRIMLQMELAAEYEKINLPKAISILLNADQNAQQLNNDSLEVRVAFTLGNCFFNNGAYDQAIASYKRYYDYYSSRNDDRNLLFVLPNLGAVAIKSGDVKKALTYYHQAESLYNKIRDKIGEVAYYKGIVVLKNNIANIHNEQKNYPKAIAIYKEALALSEKKGYLMGIGNVCRNLGNIYINTNKLDSALAFLSRSYSIKKSTKDISSLTSTCYSLALFYKKTGNDIKYKEYLDEAYNYATQTRLLSMLCILEWNYYKIHQSNGRYKSALESFERYKSLSDTINNLQNVKKLIRTQTLLEIEKVQKDKEMAQQRRETRYIITMILALAITIIFGLFVKMIRNKNQRLMLINKANELERQNLEQAVEIKNQELTTNVLYLVQKNELISGIIKKLYDLKIVLTGEKAEAVGYIISELKIGLNTGNWEEFEMRFQQVNSEFYTRLSDRYPQLTPNERRLCALLRLNMSTKEIMAMTGQNAKSVEMARHRLRKKLDIEQADNLVNFFMKI